MEKVIYLLWRDEKTSADEFCRNLRERAVPALKKAGAMHVHLNLADADVAPAAALKQQHLKSPPDALVQLWVHSAIAHLRKPVDEALRPFAARSAAYLVTASQPLINQKHVPLPGERTHGFSQIALLRTPSRLSHAEWLDIWHNSHTIVAVETQSTFEYIQNVVVRTLTPDAPKLDAIVEESFPPEAMKDYKVFFDAPGDEAKMKKNLQRMMESVHRFIEPGTIDVIPTSQYRV